tara:strand:- start:869 stop:1681 length:813 start_codon:yes stop_codon:yes gene_type:complete
MLIWFLLITLSHAYHTTDEIFQKIQHECDTVAQLTCTMHKDIMVVDWNAHLPRDIVWSYNEHAREKITGELALKSIQAFRHSKPTRRITVVPILNVWGRKMVERGKRCLRKNRMGVDTNRNFPTRYKRHYASGSQEYEGKHPLSEKESILISNLLKGAKRYVNIHSGEFSLYMPWDSRTDHVPNYNRMNKQLQLFKQHCPQCNVGPAAKTSSYKAFGTSVDYAIEIGVEEAYTFEIFGSGGNCDRMFNPYGLQKVKVVSMWKKIMALAAL